MIALLAGIALSTLISEDLASIGAGLLARDGHLPIVHAIVACVVGVYVGDLGLWGIGRLLRGSNTSVPWLSRAFAPAGVRAVTSQIDARLGAAILFSRFVPGSRLPTYLAMGAWGRRPLAFAVWSFVAVTAWTPLLVIGAMYLGDAVVTHLLTGIRIGILGSLMTAGAVFVASKLAGRWVARFARRYHQRLAQTIEIPT